MMSLRESERAGSRGWLPWLLSGREEEVSMMAEDNGGREPADVDGMTAQVWSEDDPVEVRYPLPIWTTNHRGRGCLVLSSPCAGRMSGRSA